MNRVKWISLFFFMVLLDAMGNLSSQSIGEKPSFHSVVPGRSFQFPKDHRPHWGYQTEWWYYTGFMETVDGREFGIQYTLFKVELEPVSRDNPNPPILSIVHLGITDTSLGVLHSHSDMIRVFPGLAEFQDRPNGFRYRGRGRDLQSHYEIQGKMHSIRVASHPRKPFVSLQMDVQEKGPVLLQGDAGYSAKDEEGGASYYFSIPTLTGDAKIQMGNRWEEGKVSLWLDREFSARFLGKGQVGWDWFHATLEDGRKVLGFQVRSRDSSKTNYSYGMVWDGKDKIIQPIQFQARKLRQLRSGSTYPLIWQVKVGEELLYLNAIVPESEMQATLPYWEGPVRVYNNQRKVIGRGYLEMTGYGKPLPDWL